MSSDSFTALDMLIYLSHPPPPPPSLSLSLSLISLSPSFFLYLFPPLLLPISLYLFSSCNLFGDVLMPFIKVICPFFPLSISIITLSFLFFVLCFLLFLNVSFILFLPLLVSFGDLHYLYFRVLHFYPIQDHDVKQILYLQCISDSCDLE